LFEQANGAGRPDVAALPGNLGTVYEGRCDYTAARMSYEPAAPIVDETCDDRDAGLARLRFQALSSQGRILGSDPV
jgi:hypothetical protein